MRLKSPFGFLLCYVLVNNFTNKKYLHSMSGCVFTLYVFNIFVYHQPKTNVLPFCEESLIIQTLIVQIIRLFELASSENMTIP